MEEVRNTKIACNLKSLHYEDPLAHRNWCLNSSVLSILPATRNTNSSSTWHYVHEHLYLLLFLRFTEKPCRFLWNCKILALHIESLKYMYSLKSKKEKYQHILNYCSYVVYLFTSWIKMECKFVCTSWQIWSIYMYNKFRILHSLFFFVYILKIFSSPLLHV